VTVSLKSINHLVFVVERYCIFFEIRTEFLNATEKVVLKGLTAQI